MRRGFWKYGLLGILVVWSTTSAFRCGGLVIECLATSDCIDGRACVASRCVAPTPITCQSNDDCKPNQRCDNSVCRGASCTHDKDCLHYERCVQGACTPAVPCDKSKELCNGKDDDCDGLVDEDFPNLNKACTIGVGFCKSTGDNECKADGTMACNAIRKFPNEESCNNIDDDCDGKVDGLVKKCYEGSPPESAGGGVCRQGTKRCDAGSWTSCEGQILPSKEICGDNIDNDCNGSAEEGCECKPGETRPCGESDVGACKKGRQTCSAGKWAPCQGEVKAVKEVCDDKLDNDCDGSVDEDCQTGTKQAYEWCNDTDKRCAAGLQCHVHLCQHRCDPNKGYEKNPDCPRPTQQVCTGVCRNKCFNANSRTCEPHMHCPSKGQACAPNEPPRYGSQTLGMPCNTSSNPPLDCDGEKDLVCIGGKCRQSCDPRSGNAGCPTGESCIEATKSPLGGYCNL